MVELSYVQLAAKLDLERAREHVLFQSSDTCRSAFSLSPLL